MFMTNQRISDIGRSFKSVFDELEVALPGIVVGDYRQTCTNEVLVNGTDQKFGPLTKQMDDHRLNIISTVSIIYTV